MPRWMMVPLALMVLVPGIAPAGAQQAEPVRIGVFDPETVWKLTEIGKKYNADLSEARDKLQADIDKKQAEIDAVRDKLRQQQASLSDDKAAQMQKDIQNRVIELNRLNDDATREMKSQLGEVQNRFQQMLLETVEAFGKEKNYTLILNKGVIDYNAPQIDVTQSLIQKFNEMHKVPPSTAAKPQPKKTPDKPKDSGGL
ncbi:MAG TPA: OmpH family outer membrane protein [Candidatus Polarisedimenticolia bacterium]|nr:OmpH family outer membrane protein [Candidatus Polarisedimenticolia bacterium]